MSGHDDDLIFEVGDEEGGGAIGNPAGTVVRITADQVPAAFRQHFVHAIALAQQAALDTAQAGVTAAVQMAADEDLVYLGDYIRGFRAVPTPDGAMMLNDAPYAHVIEYGRLPGRKAPPSDAIEEWVSVKLGVDDPGLAWVIAQKIGREGTPPHHVMARAEQQMEALYPVSLAARLSRG